MARTTLDQKIAKLEAELKNAKAAKSKEARTERTGQLVSVGIMIEQVYKAFSKSEREKMRSWAERLDNRNKTRAQAFFDRVEAEVQKKNDSSDVPE
ncbi:hypothetical protein LJB81_04090 [Desulfovibrio sp. OttesenSCG-928-M14]|nr:hypothetical protein [Desulfovibrio sp. OttesenSCG-928-M14]MDL2280080.1 hypothetical protein [Desulfovibrio sp. OttesenSCG-928-G11]